MSRTEQGLREAGQQNVNTADPYELGKKHALRWIDNPQGRPLTDLRFDYRHYLYFYTDLGSGTNKEGLSNTAEIQRMISRYDAGIDHVLDDAIRLLQLQATGGLQ